MKVHERFLEYVAIDTKSDPSSETCPSTEIQKDLGKLLVKQLLEMGLEDASMDENGYIIATLPSNTDKEVPTIGYVAHMDTAPDFSGTDVKARIIENYDGSDIVLNKELDIIMSPSYFEALDNYHGLDLIVTDGTTLLGADNKAGVAEIMTMVQYYVENPDVAHGTIKIGFTPDEEIGRGANFFDVEKFNADFAYTLDGGPIGELEYESFNANNFKVTINGRNVHPGYAKDRMISALEIVQEFHNMLPNHQRPQYTENYDGFYHQISINGTVDNSETTYILRHHDKEAFEQMKAHVERTAEFLNKKYGEHTVILEMKDMYYNMAEKIEPVFHIVDIAEEAMIELGIKPLIKPIRGGTDGARLSFMGLPTPNIFAGGHNFHGRHEFVPINSMEMAVKTTVRIIEKYAKATEYYTYS